MWEYPIPVPSYNEATEIPRWNKVTQQWDIIQLNDMFPQSSTSYNIPPQV
jgi:hypothetical protein